MLCPACKADNPTGAVPCPHCGSQGTMIIRDPDLLDPDADTFEKSGGKERDTFKYDRATARQDSLMVATIDDMNTGTGTGTGATSLSGSPVGEITGRSGSRIGTFISKRYELIQLLGKGGMGLVYKAKDHELDEEVAIKLLQPEYTSELSEIERLKREIVTARRITHPNVIRIHEFGMDDESGEAFISMEVLPGGSLEEEMRGGVLPMNRAINIAIGICEGLGSAHEQGIIHRDLKPENVLFAADGRAKLVDFGLARTAGSTQHTVWGVTGTPRFMSPEQSLGGPATPRTDVYSMGVVLFQLFTGQFPFDGRNIEELAQKHAEDPPPKPRSLRKEIPARLETIILRALEKDAQKRWRNANEMAVELRGLKEASNPGTSRPAEPKSSGQDSTILIRAEDVDAPTSDSTVIGPAIGTGRAAPERERGSNLAAREASNPGARLPTNEPRREPSNTGRNPVERFPREPSPSNRIPSGTPSREPSFASGRPTQPPLRPSLQGPPTEPRPRVKRLTTSRVILYGGALLFATAVPVVGYFLSEYLSTFFKK